MFRRFISSCILLLSLTYSSAALDFEVSPNDNGTLDIFLDHSWTWTTGWFSGFNFAYMNPLSIDESDDLYVATSGTSVEASVDLLGYRWLGPVSFSIAGNILFNPSRTKEVGYLDHGIERYFLVNERDIQLILPRIKSGVQVKAGRFRAEVDGELAPWLKVLFKQKLSVNTAGPRTETSLDSDGLGTMAWSIRGSLSLSTAIALPSVEGSVDMVPIEYSYIALGEDGDGNIVPFTTSLDSTMINLAVYGGFSLHGIKLGGSSPRIMIGYAWSGVKDNLTGENILDEPELRLKLGLGL